MLVYLMWYTLGDAEYSADDHLGLDLLSFWIYLWMLWCYWLVLIPCSVDYISRKVNEQLMWRIHWIHFFYPLVFLLQFCLNILDSIDVFISDINNLTFFLGIRRFTWSGREKRQYRRESEWQTERLCACGWRYILRLTLACWWTGRTGSCRWSWVTWTSRTKGESFFRQKSKDRLD